MSWELDSTENEVIRMLNALLKDPSVRADIEVLVECVQAKLTNSRDSMAWQPIPLSLYGHRLPAVIRSSWVFVIRAGAVTGAERHPNSHQRMMSFSGYGDLQTRRGDSWQSQHLSSDPHVPLECRWIVIPPMTWHQAVVGEADWVVISFHTVPEHELIEERPPTSFEHLHQRKHYAG